MNILVSGIGSDIGFGVGRILKNDEGKYFLHGIDIHDQHPGAFIFDKCSVAPRALVTGYIEWIKDYIQQYDIDVFIPTSEAEISRLNSEGIAHIAGAKILITNNLAITKSLDKFECLNYLSSHGISVPVNGLVGQEKPVAYPVIVKPRSGQGSKNILTVNNEKEFTALSQDGFVWQEYLLPEDQEYTCAVYRSSVAGTRILILKRKLVGGLTGSGEVIDNDEILNYVKKIADILELNGAINIQLRLTATGPKLFEINPRLSSTLVFRDKMGFCDLGWWLSDVMATELKEYIAPKAGTKFYRGAQEYILFN